MKQEGERTKMSKFTRKWKIRLVSVVLVVLLAGCQPFEGFDLNQLLLTQMDIVSVEEKGSYELKIEWNETYIENNEDKRFAALARLLSQIRLDIEKAQTNADGSSAAEGTIALGGKTPVGFIIRTDESGMYFEVDGARQPLFIDFNEFAGGSWPRPNFSQVVDNTSLAKEAAAYFVRHLPNPPILKITRENTDVGGQSLATTRVHAEIKGDQLGEWLLQYLDALLQDEEGFRAMLQSMAEWMNEIYSLDPEWMEETGFPEDDADARDARMDSFVEEGLQELFPLLEGARSSLEELRQGSEWQMIFDEGVELKLDLWADDRLHIRKTETELVIAPAVFRLPFSPVHGITLRSQYERWNVNEDVEVPAPGTPEGAFGVANLADMSSHKLLRMLEEDSVLYDLLKNELQIDDSYFALSPYNFYGTAPFIAEDGTVIVPVRVAVENFDIAIGYEHDTRTIRFYDEGTQQEIVFRIGSSTAMVNGQAVELSRPLELIDNYSYMDADDLFKLMKASYTYKKDEWEDLWVNVERDL
jgi:hypothetical protein